MPVSHFRTHDTEAIPQQRCRVPTCTALTREQISREKSTHYLQYCTFIGNFVILYCKNACLTSQLRALRFFIRFAFPRL